MQRSRRARDRSLEIVVIASVSDLQISLISLFETRMFVIGVSESGQVEPKLANLGAIGYEY